jgi:hypothetical protein
MNCCCHFGPNCKNDFHQQNNSQVCNVNVGSLHNVFKLKAVAYAKQQDERLMAVQNSLNTGHSRCLHTIIFELEVAIIITCIVNNHDL